MAEKKRLTFAPFNPLDTDEEKKISVTAFTMLRNALKNSETKPEAPEQPGSWERTARLHLFFSKGEARETMLVGVNRQTGEDVMASIITLNSQGYTNVVSVETFTLLQSIWTEWVKKNGTRAVALQIFLTNQWLAECVTDADAEPALASGAVKTE